jgi:DNA repair photolyase
MSSLEKKFAPLRGRGATANPDGRFTRQRSSHDPELCDEWPAPGKDTRLLPERSRSIVSTNQSPDINFRQSINPYRGCEHGCVYCYARPAHAYMDLSPGLDFETQIFFKADAAQRLREFLARPGYRCQTIAMGANTDAYQPAEKQQGITRRLLEILYAHRHPVSLITKSALIERDLDLLTKLAADRLVQVSISVTTLDNDLKRVLEPRTASPARRLRSIETLTAAGIPVNLLLAPVIPGLNDHELDAILAAGAAAGAQQADYILLRLPHEVQPLFIDWLQQQRPLRAKRIMSLLRQYRGGRANDPCFGSRMRGEGPLAELLQQRFAGACRRHKLQSGHSAALNTRSFCVPGRATQGELFDAPG